MIFQSRRSLSYNGFHFSELFVCFEYFAKKKKKSTYTNQAITIFIILMKRTFFYGIGYKKKKSDNRKKICISKMGKHFILYIYRKVIA